MVAKAKADYRERASRKAVPKTEPSWLAEVRGVSTFLAKRVTLTESAGKSWFESMKAYYGARLEVLAKNIPKGMSKLLAKEVIRSVKTKLQ